MNSQNSLEDLLKKYNSADVSYISVEELRMHQLNDEVTILDAREKEEFEVSHIKNAKFVGFKDFDAFNVAKLPKDSPVVVYCSLGIRSEKIGEKLQNLGFDKVYNLYGGIFEWKNANFPVINAEGNETEKVHAFSKTWGKWLKNAEKVY